MVNKLMIAFCEEQKRDHDPCIILINQTRFAPNVMFGDPERMPGGEAQKFLSSLRVRLSSKNVIDKGTNTLVFKDTKVTVKKSKVPVRAASFEFSLCVRDHDDLKVGETNSFAMVKSHLQALNLIVKVPKGYALLNASFGVFSTLTAMQDRYAKDLVFRMALQAMVIESYKDKLILVEETDYSPKDVAPGTAVDVETGEILRVVIPILIASRHKLRTPMARSPKNCWRRKWVRSSILTLEPHVVESPMPVWKTSVWR